MIQSLEELVVPGRILRLFCSFTNPPKEKFVVVAATHPFCLGFLINSNPTALQKSKKHLSEELISVSARDGKQFRVSAGMLVSAGVNLGSRTVMEHLLSPVQKTAHEAGGRCRVLSTVVRLRKDCLCALQV